MKKDASKINIDNEILNLYNKSIIDTKATNYKFHLNEECFKNIWYNYNLNIHPKQAKQIASSFSEIKDILKEKENTLHQSHNHLLKHLGKDYKKYNNIDLFTLSLVLFILLFIILI